MKLLIFNIFFAFTFFVVFIQRISAQISTPPSTKPTRQPTSTPTTKPSRTPSQYPSAKPTPEPSFSPSNEPLPEPSPSPSNFPSPPPSPEPSPVPSLSPSAEPTVEPTSPTYNPSAFPSTNPSIEPTFSPSQEPTPSPTALPSIAPTQVPSEKPSQEPTSTPSIFPSAMPTPNPSVEPSSKPTPLPSATPSKKPTSSPTRPTPQPTSFPSRTILPSILGIYYYNYYYMGTRHPSRKPTAPTFSPTPIPTAPSALPTVLPTVQPTTPTAFPSPQPTVLPSQQPTPMPSIASTYNPTCIPSAVPTYTPTFAPVVTSVIIKFGIQFFLQNVTGESLLADSLNASSVISSAVISTYKGYNIPIFTASTLPLGVSSTSVSWFDWLKDTTTSLRQSNEAVFTRAEVESEIVGTASRNSPTHIGGSSSAWCTATTSLQASGYSTVALLAEALNNDIAAAVTTGPFLPTLKYSGSASLAMLASVSVTNFTLLSVSTSAPPTPSPTKDARSMSNTELIIICVCTIGGSCVLTLLALFAYYSRSSPLEIDKNAATAAQYYADLEKSKSNSRDNNEKNDDSGPEEKTLSLDHPYGGYGGFRRLGDEGYRTVMITEPEKVPRPIAAAVYGDGGLGHGARIAKVVGNDSHIYVGGKPPYVLAAEATASAEAEARAAQAPTEAQPTAKADGGDGGFLQAARKAHMISHTSQSSKDTSVNTGADVGGRGTATSPAGVVGQGSPVANNRNTPVALAATSALGDTSVQDNKTNIHASSGLSGAWGVGPQGSVQASSGASEPQYPYRSSWFNVQPVSPPTAAPIDNSPWFSGAWAFSPPAASDGTV